MSIFSRSRKNRPAEAAPVAVSAPRHAAPPTHALDAGLNARILEIGSDFLARSRKHKGGAAGGGWAETIMNWATSDPEFKVQMFRYVDCFPMLRSSEEIYDHLRDYMNQPGVKPPQLISTLFKAGAIAKGAAAASIRTGIKGMAGVYIAGTDARDALPNLRKLWDRGLAFSVDLLGEACVSEAEAKDYQERYLDLVTNLPTDVNAWKANPRLESDHLGPIPRTNVSIKISSLYSMTDPINTQGSIDALIERIGPILEAAAKHNVFINFDMEQFSLKDLTLELFMACCERYDFKAGLAMQAYLRSGRDDARRIIEWSKKSGRQVTVRLVKGAYWDYETIRAEEMGWETPVWSKKPSSDACFEDMAALFLNSTPRSAGEGGVKLALGSHNVRSIAHSLATLRTLDLPDNALELQMLHGMGDNLKEAAIELGLRLREYVPVGEMLPGMAYLVRRLLENTSNESWLLASSDSTLSPQDLLADPRSRLTQPDNPPTTQQAARRHALSPAIEGLADGLPFYTEALRNFAFADVRDRFARSIADAKVPQVPFTATEKDADAALSACQQGFPAWRDTDILKRAQILCDAAAIMRKRRDELAGVMIREAGKTWREADADVCESIDFCEYYARCAVPLFRPQRLGRFVGELDQQFHEPRGITVVIAPWNFPMAILTGMTVASLVCGNPTIMKPAELTPGIAQIVYDILIEAGVPKNILHFVPGSGRTVGARLVNDPRTALIAFTGSKQVGLNIYQSAGITPPEQTHVKHVVCEMGGKNALIIDASADLDEAVLAVRQSAFGFQGQKCSACSRVIVHASNYDLFLTRLVEATRALKIGNPLDPGTDIGPVIDRKAWESINKYIEIGKSEARLALAMDLPDPATLAPGRDYIAPHIFADVPHNARIMREEIFGPVLAVTKVDSFDQALELANSSEYKLTGGLFSRKPTHLERARREFRVGNLYLNRGITGALVGRQPFGGFGMSGGGTKAGGSEYLYHFTVPRAITENTMRRGFAPGLQE